MPPHLSLYVIQLRKRCARCKARRRPDGRCCVYVGSTAKSHEERLAEHLDPPPTHKKTVVTHCGGSLRPDLATRHRYWTRPEAEAAEVALARSLADRGYTVFGPRLARESGRDGHGSGRAAGER